MGTLRCTKKLLTELKLKPSADAEESIGIGNWHANLLWIEHRKCVLFTNDQTLFSFLVTGMKKPQFENFHEVFRLNLFKNLSNENLPQNQIEYVLDEHRKLQIAKTNNRSVLASMNELAYQVRWLIHDMGGLINSNLTSLNHDLNRIPMGAIESIFSVEELSKVLNQVDT